MNDEEIEKMIDNYFEKTPLDQIINDLEKAGIFKEFDKEEIVKNIIKNKRKEG